MHTKTRYCVFTVRLHVMQRTVLSRPFSAFCPSICRSVCQTCAFLTKRKKRVLTFIRHMKDHLSKFSDKKNDWWGTTPST